MVQSLRLRISEELPATVLQEIFRRINPDYLKKQLIRKGIPDRKCYECGTTTYELTERYEVIPTPDLTLRRDSDGFHGLASGAELSDKLLVKAIALRGIQEILRKYRLSSRIDFSDVDDSEYARLSRYGVIRRRRNR